MLLLLLQRQSPCKFLVCRAVLEDQSNSVANRGRKALFQIGMRFLLSLFWATVVAVRFAAIVVAAAAVLRLLLLAGWRSQVL